MTMPETPVVTVKQGKLQWESVKDATIYQILKDDQLTAEVCECEWSIPSAGEYRVVAVNAKGIHSFTSEPLRYYDEASV